MSTNVKTADLTITIIVSLLKAAGLGPEADRILDAIEGAKDCIGLIEDIKNETVSDPNKELIRSLFKAIKEEVRSIRANLKDQGLEKDEIESTVDALIETTRLTVKQLAQDDDALLDAARLPDSFFKILVHRAEPLPDWCDDTTETLYEKLLRRVSAEFVGCAHNFDRFDKVALISLLRDSLSAKMQMNRIEHGVQEDRAINLETNRVVKKLAQQHLSSTPSRVFFGSRPDVVAGERFVERDEHKQLKKVITDPKRDRTVLLGMRGCGKTQLAASLAKQCEDANWNLVAWINAVSRRTTTSDLVELAKQLGIDTSDQPAQDVIVRRCLDHLKSAPPTDRLIVFDNVENIDHLPIPMPSGDGLRVVATTTNNTGWDDPVWTTIKVGVFDHNESIDYLLEVTKSDDRKAADALAERLGDLPLAIAQAAAFARKRKLDLAQYLERLDAYRSEHVMPAVPGDYYARDVATALRVAIDDTLKELEASMSRAARRHLGVLALLAESGVPTRWLDPLTEEHHYQDPRDRDRAADDDAHDALTELLDRSIIQQSADGSMTMLHRLQAQVFRESWDEKETAEAYESSTTLLSNVNIDRFPRNDTDSRRRETRDLIEQLHAIGEQKYARNIFTHENVPLRVFQALSNAHDLALFSEALTLEASINTIQEILGPEHPGTLAASNNLAHAYEAAGYFHDAIGMYEQVLADHTRVFGASHPYTFTVANNLAGAYESGGYFDKAINLYRQVLADRIYALGPDHPDVLTTQNDLAYACVSAGLHSEAIAEFDLVFKKRLSLLGPDDLHTLLSRNNLASAYASAGYSITAIALFLQAFVEFRRVLGPDHHYTLAARRNIAELYASAGLLNAAVPLYEDVLSDYQRLLGTEHPLTKTVRENLEAARQELARQEEAAAE